MTKRVFVNSAASDTGRLEQPYAAWTDTEIQIAALVPGVRGSRYYFKVENNSGVESDWFGPVDVEHGRRAVVPTAGNLTE